MTDELASRLRRLVRDLEGTVPAVSEGTAGRLVVEVARVRRVRMLRRSAVAGAAVVVLALAAALGTGRLHAWSSAPAAAPTASSTPVPSSPVPDLSQVAPSSAQSAAATQAATPVRDSGADDATVLARIAAPRTGEVWTTPQRAVDLDPGAWGGSMPYLVGHRGSARIYAAVAASDPNVVRQLVEVDGAGMREIACPSARSLDPCALDAGKGWLKAAVDRTTFYDSLTLPSSLTLAPGWSIRTAATASGYFTMSPGRLEDTSQDRTVATFGPLRVVEKVSPLPGEALDVHTYLLVTPMGVVVPVAAGDLPGADFDAIHWDAGREPVTPSGASAGAGVLGVPAGGGCNLGHFSEQVDPTPSGWERAGTTPDGHGVYLPTAENSLPDTIWAANVSGASKYFPFRTASGFRDANALYAVQGPDGTRQLRIVADAAGDLEEGPCAF